jgi:hypothetical protein
VSLYERGEITADEAVRMASNPELVRRLCIARGATA